MSTSTQAARLGLSASELAATKSLVSGGGISEVVTDAVEAGRSGVVNGTALDSGQLWDCTGTGAATAIYDPAGYIKSGDLTNTYLRVNTGQPITRVEQLFSGPVGTVPVMLDGTLSDMLHVNFTSSGTAVATYWKSGVGSAISVESEIQIAAVPNINDGASHKLAVEIAGYTFASYVDGTLISVGLCKYLPSIVGNWTFAQLHTGVADKVYGLKTYSYGENQTDATKRQPIRGGLIDGLAATINELVVGKPGANFLPDAPIFLHHEGGKKVSVSSAGATLLDIFAVAAGQAATLRIRPTLGTIFDIVGGGDGVLRMKYQTTDRLTIPANTQRIDQAVPMRLPSATVANIAATYAPATFAQCLVYLSDGASNKRAAVSDGTVWRYLDGAAV